MSYPPSQHQDNDKAHLIEVIKTYPLATVISVMDNEPFITHLPLIYANGQLLGHIDKFNPQAELLKDGHNVTVIFGGPQCYISPSIYSTTQLPTWNYIKVHLKGKANAIVDPEIIKQSIVNLTVQLESPEHKFVLPMNHARMDSLIDYIRGFEIKITDWEGKFKLSQDKNPKDIRRAKEALIRANQKSIQAFLEHVFQ